MVSNIGVVGWRMEINEERLGCDSDKYISS